MRASRSDAFVTAADTLHAAMQAKLMPAMKILIGNSVDSLIMEAPPEAAVMAAEPEYLICSIIRFVRLLITSSCEGWRIS
jgi:hypothetical protein